MAVRVSLSRSPSVIFLSPPPPPPFHVYGGRGGKPSPRRFPGKPLSLPSRRSVTIAFKPPSSVLGPGSCLLLLERVCSQQGVGKAANRHLGKGTVVVKPSSGLGIGPPMRGYCGASLRPPLAATAAQFSPPTLCNGSY